MNESANSFRVFTSSRRTVDKSAASGECSFAIMLKNDDFDYYVRIDRIFCVITGVLFSVGVIANLWVLQRIVRAVTSTRLAASTPRHVFVYLGALAVTDLSLLLNCPFLIHDVANMQWNFGPFLCKCMYGNESLNKLLSGFILAALSFDQLITVRKILPKSWRTVSAAWKMIGVLTFVATILLIPLFLYTRVVTLMEPQRSPDDNLTTPAIHKCVFAPPPDMIHMATGFMLCIFVFGFCLPTFCIGISYGTILYRFAASGYLKRVAVIRNNDGSRRAPETDRRLSKNRRLITWYILLLVGIYLGCWGTYWIAALRVSFAPQYYHDPQHHDLTMTYALLYIHLLPYLNAVMNAFAYGCMANFSASATRRSRRTESNGDSNAAVRIPMTPRNVAAPTRFSIGETWSATESATGATSKTVRSGSRKAPSSAEVESESVFAA